MFGKMYAFGLFLSALVLFGQTNASAIPMWEYLSKQEKVSYFFSVFATQVENFCEDSTLNDCTHQLLRFGLIKLKSLPEDYLDAMDPYQRGGNQMIWDTLMAGHPLAFSAPKPRSTTTAKPNSFEDEPFGDFEFGSHGSESARIDNVAVLPAPKDILVQYNVRPKYNYPQNIVSYLNAIGSQKKGPYSRFQEQYASSTTTTESPIDPMDEELNKNHPLTGPMVVVVYPDGTPVRDPKPLPQDDDLEQYQTSKAKIPNFV